VRTGRGHRPARPYDTGGRLFLASDAVDIAVSILEGPGGGESISPAAPRRSARTRTARRRSRAGRPRASSRSRRGRPSATVGGRTIRSQPITLVIHGGSPDRAHFTVAPVKLNFPALDVAGTTNPVFALVGDRYGNPVQPGTQVYFTTTGGIIGGPR
jgi:hypothetical protein